MPRRRSTALLTVLVLTALARVATAQDQPGGTFQITQDQTTVQIPEWGSDCGPRPESHTGSTGRQVQVTANNGQLSVADGRRTLRTDGCWSDNPRLQRVTATHAGSTWTITCTTAQSDYQQEQGTYTVTSTPDRIAMRESSSYSWQLRGSHCRATATRSLSYARVGPPPAPAVDAAVAVRPPPAPARCATPGAPTRLDVAPGRRALAPGGRVCFRARLLDANGCEVALGARTATWQIARGAGSPGAQDATMDGACVRAPAGSTVADYQVTATIDALSGHGTASVVSPEELRSLIAQHIEDEDGGVAPTAGPAPGTGVGAMVVRTPSPASNSSSGAGSTVLLVVGIALLLGVAGLVLATRRRKPRVDDPPAQPNLAPDPLSASVRMRRDAVPLPELRSAPAAPPATVRLTRRCPTCNQLFAAEIAFCPEHGTPLVDATGPAPVAAPPVAIAAVAPVAPVAPVAADAPATAARPAPVCPTCNLPVEGGSRFCPRDGTDVSEGAKPLRCPVCGRRFAIGTAFCGEDGSGLVTG